jgi:predicted Rossmann fold flavoprotein
MTKGYPRGASFLKKAFYLFGPSETVQWFQNRNVLLKTEADGRMFPVTNDSQTVIQCFLKEAGIYGVHLQMNCAVTDVSFHNSWKITLLRGQPIEADYICIATGGFQKLQQYDWLQGTGHTIIPPIPSLFTFNIPASPLSALMGVSVEATVKIRTLKLSLTGPLLITHWGLSGPVILKLSGFAARELHACNYQFDISVNWLPDYNEQTLRDLFQEFRRTIPAKRVSGKNVLALPVRVWNLCMETCGAEKEVCWGQLPAATMNKMIVWLTGLTLHVSGKTTFKEEFVTAGGVDLKEIDVQTMESRLHPRLYFAGEILDVDGITGGYNFQNAWTTGYIAAQSIAEAAGK